MEIKAALESDAQTLSELALASKAHWGYPSDFMRACREELAVTAEKMSSDKFTYFKSLSGAVIVGFYALEQCTDEVTELEALFVSPSRMGEGAGKALYTHALQQATSMGYRLMQIHSDPFAADFYTACGAKYVRDVPSGSIEGRVLPLFEVKLK